MASCAGCSARRCARRDRHPHPACGNGAAARNRALRRIYRDWPPPEYRALQRPALYGKRVYCHARRARRECDRCQRFRRFRGRRCAGSYLSAGDYQRQLRLHGRARCAALFGAVSLLPDLTNRSSEKSMIRILIIWLINALALFVLPYIISSIQIRGFGTALVAAVVLALINALIRPLLVLLTLPVTMITLGLFIFAINALLFQFAAWMLKGFEFADFWSALFGSILYSLISWLLAWLILGRTESSL